MAKKVLVIDEYIDSYYISKQMVRQFLATAGPGPVEIQLSCLGGSVNHAIDICNQFREHGDVTVVMSSFNASSATLIALGAKKTLIHSNSWYLIHKPMVGISTWGNMNQDDINQFIDKLDKDKKFLEKLTAELTKMYMIKTGKSSKEIVDLMTEAKWLSAKEAKDWGFVDEIIEQETVVNLLEDDRAVAMLTENDLPVPVMAAEPPVITATSDPAEPVNQEPTITNEAVDSIWTRIIDRINALINPKIHKNADMKIFALINNVLGITALESSDDKGVYLNEAQLQAIEDRLATADRSELDRQQAETALNEATTALDAIDPTVTAAASIGEKVTAISAIIAQKPGTGAAQPKGEKDPAKDDVDWDKINSLPHNQEVDALN